MRSDPFNVYFYKIIVADYGYPAGDMNMIKFIFVEEILMNEYGSDISFTLGKTRKEE